MTTNGRASWMAALSVLALLAGCPNIGNESGTCSPGETCVCDIMGNCEKTCPGGGCHFICKGTSNCLFDCAGGRCDLRCENTGNCILSCPGNDCTISCAGGTSSNCILRSCQKGCPKDGGPDRSRDLAPGLDPRVPDLRKPDLARDLRPADGKTLLDAKPDVPVKADLAKPDSPKPDLSALDLPPAKLDTCGSLSGPKSPAAGSDSTAVGTVAWTTPGEIVSQNAGSGSLFTGVAYGLLYTGASPTHHLVASGFGLGVPAAATVSGIEVEVRRRATLPGVIADDELRLVTGGAAVGASRAASAPWSISWSYTKYGGPTDLWGRSWTAAELNAAGFGVALSAKWVGATGSDLALVDHVRVTVHYGGSCCVPKTCAGQGQSCGPLDDGCGTTLDCGSCATGDTCLAGTCGCKDGVKNGTESDVDCGGVCATCAAGKSCGSPADCVAGLFCSDGVCCQSACTGLCQACVLAKTGVASGTCASIAAGTDPDGECALDPASTCQKTGQCKSGACELYPSGTPCATATCSAGTATAAKSCDGSGQCIGPAPAACPAPYLCNAAGTACQSCSDGLKNGAETDVDCGGSTASCARCAQGKVCGAASDCATGLSCVDGVCCQSACTALCMACSSAKTGVASGTCANITPNTDPDNECTGNRVCVNGACTP